MRDRGDGRIGRYSCQASRPRPGQPSRIGPGREVDIIPLMRHTPLRTAAAAPGLQLALGSLASNDVVSDRAFRNGHPGSARTPRTFEVVSRRLRPLHIEDQGLWTRRLNDGLSFDVPRRVRSDPLLLQARAECHDEKQRHDPRPSQRVVYYQTRDSLNPRSSLPPAASGQ